MGRERKAIEVTKLARESSLSRVVEMVAKAQTQKSPIQRFTDGFERIFVPAVLVGGRVTHRAAATVRFSLCRIGGQLWAARNHEQENSHEINQGLYPEPPHRRRNSRPEGFRAVQCEIATAVA